MYLKLYIGCMFSGKSTSLLNEIQRYSKITDKILIINHEFDRDRWDNDLTVHEHGIGILQTHDGKECSAIILNELKELNNNTYYAEKYASAELIFIDEAQFYPDLFYFLRTELHDRNVNNKRKFIVSGLSGDFLMNPIGDVLKLIPMADEIIKLDAYCVDCKDGTIASFTKRLSDDKTTVLVGNDTMYKPVCRKHYLSK
ncbi:Thymidine kinase [Gammaproteobacteria bacterium]